MSDEQNPSGEPKNGAKTSDEQPWQAPDAMEWTTASITSLTEAFGGALAAGRREEAERLREQAIAAIALQSEDADLWRCGFDAILREEVLGLCAAGSLKEVVATAALLRNRCDLLTAGLVRAAFCNRLTVAKVLLAALPERPSAGLCDAIAAVVRRVRDNERNPARDVTPLPADQQRQAAPRPSAKTERERLEWRAIAAGCMERMASDPAQREDAVQIAVRLEPLCPGLMAAIAGATGARTKAAPIR